VKGFNFPTAGFASVSKTAKKALGKSMCKDVLVLN
jgi:hypothetical protein